MKILGIDEAGRGPVVGPMVIVGYEIDDSKVELLRELGVKDSKELSREAREKLFDKLVELSDETYIEIVTNKEINEWMQAGLSLNLLELKKFAKIILRSKAEEVFIDCPSPNIEKFVLELRKYLNKEVKIIAEHEADKKFLVVSAASIIAKVIRDREIDKIKKEIGVNFGSGYPSDPLTKKALEEYYDKLKPYIRVEWATVKKYKEKLLQKSLLDYL